MAKELPYFQFEPAEYLTKDISFCSLAAQGLFTNLCSYYWQRECKLSKTQFLKRLNHPDEFQELIDEGVIDIDGDSIIVKFLDIQYDNATKRSKINSINGSKGGRPTKYKTKKNPNKTETKPNQKQNESKSKGIREDNIREDKYIIDIVSPPKGVDALHFYIAKSYHQMFFEYKGGKTLQESKVGDWVKTIRLLIEKDNVSVKQLIGIKLFLQAGINKERGVDTFWSDTIYSVNALRKKSKDGTFQIDRIKQAAKRWLDKNPEKESEIYKAEEKLMNKTNGR